MTDIRVEKPYPMGVSRCGDRIQFTVDGGGCSKCLLKIYKNNSKSVFLTVKMDNTYKTGNVFSCSVKDIFEKNCDYEYVYEFNGTEYVDSYAGLVSGRNKYGKGTGKLRARLIPDVFADKKKEYTAPGVGELVLYQLHVRGFSKHKSFDSSNKGTFKGICDKIPYLKSLGITGVLLLPAYEYNEYPRDMAPVGMPKDVSYNTDKNLEYRINYWGYTTDCFYFAPKASYAAGDNAAYEFSCMVEALHSNGIAVFMDMYFPGSCCMGTTMDCLRYWVVNYNIDGFRINQEAVSEDVISNDPVLSDTVILGNYWDGRHNGAVYRNCSNNSIMPYNRAKLVDCNDGYMVMIRRFIKGDDNNILELIRSMTENGYNSGQFSSVNYLANVNGFTLMDSLSYGMKHNEDNGENNRDGTDYNYSTNCGFEGKTRRKYVTERRMKYIKNELMLLMVSSGIPMILAGDEFGNSQNGNNNAYCQDNRISWLDWGNASANSRLIDYLSRLIAIRKEYIAGNNKKNYGITSGIPEISYHGVKPWATDSLFYSRTAGIMIASKGLYIAINLDGKESTFELPELFKGCRWKMLINTESDKLTGCLLPPETIAIYKAVSTRK